MDSGIARVIRTIALLSVLAWSVALSPMPAPSTAGAPLSFPSPTATAFPVTTIASAPPITATPVPPPALMTQALAVRTTIQNDLHTLPTASPPGLQPIPTVGATATVAPAPPMDGNGPLSGHRLVTWYGQPDSNLLGVLGEYDDPRVMIGRLRQQADAYTAADPAHPAIPTLELIASVAADNPGPDGLYLNPTRPALIEQYVQMAQDNNCLLLLDVQFGYDTMAHELQRLVPYLRTGHVHLALDPEFHVKRGEIPGEEFGSLSAAEITEAQTTLKNLVEQYHLPDKVLVIHQFRTDMLPDKGAIKPVPHVQLTIVMDGFGAPGTKIENYGKFIRDEPIQYGGIKLFYKQDKPLMTPKEVVALTPSPLVVIYQ